MAFNDILSAIAEHGGLGVSRSAMQDDMDLPITAAGAKDYAKGLGAGVAGMPGDMAGLVNALMQMKRGVPVQAADFDFEYGTDALGKALGADVESGEFMMGSMGLPGFEDLLKAGTMAGMVSKISGYGVSDDLLKALFKAAPDADASIAQKGDKLTLSKIEIPKESRNQGIGGKFMEELVNYADKNELTAALTAAGDFGGSKAGQQRFYKRYGFKPNKGRNKDYSIMENMIRNPAGKATNAAGLPILPNGKLDVAAMRAERAENYVSDDYRIEHKPMNEDGGAARLHDLTAAMPDDIYGPNALRYYGSGDSREAGVLQKIHDVRGNPNAEVTVYRGVPGDAKGINEGDWITLDRSVAQDYADMEDAGKVLSMKVKADDITAWGDSLLEQGYYPKKLPMDEASRMARDKDMGLLERVANMSPTGREWSELSIDDVDRAAFGFAEHEVKSLNPNDLKIKWQDDLDNVMYEIKQSGKTEKQWADSVDLSEPIDVIFEDGAFKIDDGHHRYMAAKIRGEDLPVSLEIRDKPHRPIVEGAQAAGYEVNQELMDALAQ